MSGDVFGNGMLLSKQTRLLAAFDHRHIFLDPDPDPATSWTERARMFALPSSSWADYNAKLISKGGGVFARSLKSIPISAQVKAMLEIKADAMAPTELINAILKSQAELLYLGGIGTYVKAPARGQRRCRRQGQRCAAGQRLRPAGQGRGRGREPRPDAGRAYRIRARRAVGSYTDAIDNSAASTPPTTR